MRILVQRRLTLAIVALTSLWTCAPIPLAAQATVEQLYADAVAKEKAVRTALASARPSPAVLKAVRTVVSDFEQIARLYPASGYGDDALWRAGLTSLEAFTKLGDSQDRDAGGRLLRALVSRYPTSTLAKHVPQVLGPLGVPSSAPAAPVAAASPSATAPARPPAPAARRSSAGIATIKNISRTVLPDVVRITIELDSEVAFREERLENPSRVFVDLAGTRAAPALLDRTLRFDDGVDLARQIRIGRHPNNTTRVVLDALALSSYSVYPLYEPYRLVIDCLRVPAADAVREAVVLPVLPSRTVATDWTGTIASRQPPRLDAVQAALAPPELESSALKLTAPLVPPQRNLAGGFSIARQLGLKVSRIVIDPGHGGHDPGAKGRDLTEADLVLDVALRLEKLLQGTPDTEVVLTRRTDEYVPLQTRTAIANREGADLFLSIHANANRSGQVRGVETYFLNFAQNLSAAAVAARENAASGQSMNELPDLLKSIALNNKLDESRDFATYIQRALVQKLRVANKSIKDLGVKQAPFMVLIGAAMPSVLAEISFLTNSSEARLLRQPAYRQRIADALFEAIRKYQSSLRSGVVAAASQN